ncbi:hypothetical protein E2C01_056986 [Portunus trituberculatus]|uniref:Uncharacterized protein n=1 Tax=Portunus trituberculatus TaxID=210409 RepID=A0A5B7GZ53_PORTR|nr:hypothetical protein [Portunus trituberculatus]
MAKTWHDATTHSLERWVMKETLEEIKKKNWTLRAKCDKYEMAPHEKEHSSAGKVEGAGCEIKLEELRNACK